MYKCSGGVEPGATSNKSSRWSERGIQISNLAPYPLDYAASFRNLSAGAIPVVASLGQDQAVVDHKLCDTSLLNQLSALRINNYL